MIKFGNRKSLFCFFLAAAASASRLETTAAFVPTRLAASRSRSTTSGGNESPLSPCFTATLDQVEQQAGQRVASVEFQEDSSSSSSSSSQEDDQVVLPLFDLAKYTDILKDEKTYPVGSLPDEVVQSSFKILFEWGKLETVEGAKIVGELTERFERESQDILNASHYTLAVSAWARSGHAQAGKRAEEWLTRMEEIAKTNPAVTPLRVTYSVVLNAHAAQEDTKSALSILKRMEESPEMHPLVKDYNCVLTALSQKGSARAAEEILKRIVEVCRENGSEKNAPTLYSYNVVLSAWAKSKEAGASKRALEILDALHGMEAQEDSELCPCQRTYSAVMTAIARSGDPNAAELAQKVFDEAVSREIVPDAYMYGNLMHVYASINDAEKVEGILKSMEEAGLANAVAYNTVINAWKGSSLPGAAEKAERSFDHLISLGMADTISFTSVIAAYAKRGDAASAEKAESLLRRMNELRLAGDDRVEPNVQTYNSVMHAWVQAGIPERADALLENVLRIYDGGRVDMCPNVVSFSTVINGWAKSSKGNSLAQAERLFKRMVEMYEAGRRDVRPNHITYVNLVNAIVRSGEDDSAERAEKLLFQMYKQFQDGLKDIRPNAKIIAMVVDCWQKSGKSDAGDRAEALLDWMVDMNERDYDQAFAPNEFIFSSVISAWSKSNSFGKAVRARRVLEKMQALHGSKAMAAAPNTHCYTSVINSCAFCINDESEKREALKIALATYKESERSTSKNGKPNHVTYATMLGALSRLLPPSVERTAAIGSIFKRCCETGQVDWHVLRRMQSILTAIELREVFSEAMVAPGGTIIAEKIPADWHRKIPAGRRKIGLQVR